MSLKHLSELDLRNKRVLIRADLNVPLDGSSITNDLRIRASLPTIEYAMNAGAGVLLVSHLGRPTPGTCDSAYSLQPVATRLEEIMHEPVELIKNWQDGVELQPRSLKMLENIRFEVGETENKPSLARSLAALCDIYVNDAFGTAHRAHASTAGIAKHTQHTCIGLLFAREIEALDRALKNPKRPLVAVLGGAKVSGKLEALTHLKERADTLLVGGGMANTFLLAAGYDIGKSLVEKDLVNQAISTRESVDLPLPVDLMTAKTTEPDSHAFLRMPNAVPAHELIVDIGPETARRFAKIVENAGTVIWNGPMGIFERKQFADGTRVVAETIADTDAFTLAGGGDTVAAIERFNVTDRIDYISTGGGAFLDFIGGKVLPGIEALEHPT